MSFTEVWLSIMVYRILEILLMALMDGRLTPQRGINDE